MTKQQDQHAIDARRAAVAEGILHRKPYRDMAREFDVSLGTIAGDAAYIRKSWAKTYGKANESFERAVIDLDALQAEAMTTLQSLAGVDRLAAIDRVVKISDQRNRLLGLYPKPGAGDGQDIPTGPIELKIQMIEPGNRRLITEEPITYAEENADVY